MTFDEELIGASELLEFEDEKRLEWARKEYPYCHCGAKMDGKVCEAE